jgi:hypothetical protein
MALVATLVLACVLATGLVAALRPRRFTTYQEAIGYVLEQRAIGYRRVTVERVWPDTVNTIFYSANVSVFLNDARSIGGRIQCETPDGHRCTVLLRDLNIVNVPLQELSDGRPLPLLGWVQKLLTR